MTWIQEIFSSLEFAVDFECKEAVLMILLLTSKYFPLKTICALYKNWHAST